MEERSGAGVLLGETEVQQARRDQQAQAELMPDWTLLVALVIACLLWALQEAHDYGRRR